MTANLTIENLDHYARRRFELDARVELDGQLRALTVFPLYVVHPEPVDSDEPRSPWAVCLGWGGPVSPRFLVVKDGEAEPFGELPADDDVPIPLPWWADPSTAQYHRARSRRSDGVDVVWISRAPLAQLALLEAVAMAAQLGLVVRFLYGKPGHDDEWRQVVARWVGGKDGQLLGGEDLDRPTEDPERRGAIRSFRIDRIRGLELATDTIPTWQDGWVAGGAA